MTPRKDWSQIMAEGSAVFIGENSYPIKPLRHRDFGQFAAAIKMDNLLSYHDTMLGRVDPTTAARVHTALSEQVITDAKLIEAIGSHKWASWVLIRALELGGTEKPVHIVEAMPAAEVINKAAYVLQQSGLLYVPDGDEADAGGDADDANPQAGSEITGGN